MEKIDKESLSLKHKYIEELEKLIPTCITEKKDVTGKYHKVINIPVLQQMLSDSVLEGNEAYEFTWVGKKEAIAEANRATSKTLRPCKKDSANWDDTGNIYIEGDNLEALKILQESYLNRIKVIYIDPPYNTGNDLIYNDSFAISGDDYERQNGAINENEERTFINTDSNGRFHSNWCSMILSRLLLARTLLSDDGVIFISIGEEELGSLIHICDEVFGKSNCVSIISRVSKTASNMGTFFAPSIDFILCYSKNIVQLQPFVGDVDESLYTKIEVEGPRKGEKYRDDVALYQASLTLERSRNARYYITCPDGSKCIPPENKRWRVVKESVLQLLEHNMIVFKETKTSPLIDENGKKSKWNLYTKSYLNDRQTIGTLPRNYIDKFINRQGADMLKKYGIPFDFAKPVGLIKYLLKICNDKNATILDFFAGSSTTAHAVMLLNAEDDGNRKYIMVQLPEKCDEKTEAYKAGFSTISELGKERIRRVAKRIREENPNANIDYGFRAFKVDTSNTNDISYSTEDITQDLLSNATSNIKEDRTDLDLLFDCLLKEGVEITYPYSSEMIDGCTVHDYNNGALIACFDENVNEALIREIARRKPIRAIFRDSSFKTDADRINVEEIFKLLSPDTTVKVI